MRGVRRMIEEGECCIDIITQIQAVQSALRAIGRRILQTHMDTCITEAAQSRSKAEANEKIAELKRVMGRVWK